jgi:two-component system, sensor histidine kinase LadS
MQDYFKQLKIEEVAQLYKDEDSCLGFLARVKWAEGFVCRKCGHTNFCDGNTPFSRRCTRCKTQESATAHTTFHRCKVPLPYAFQIAWYSCHHPEMSLQELSEKMQIRLMTVWKLRSKIKECIECESGVIKPN